MTICYACNPRSQVQIPLHLRRKVFYNLHLFDTLRRLSVIRLVTLEDGDFRDPHPTLNGTLSLCLGFCSCLGLFFPSIATCLACSSASSTLFGLAWTYQRKAYRQQLNHNIREILGLDTYIVRKKWNRTSWFQNQLLTLNILLQCTVPCILGILQQQYSCRIIFLALQKSFVWPQMS